ncbi:MAG: protein of unknown function DUF433 [Magnetococcales bacterium]|nr:protein of unknown function DUF433 [Magnetococcales bacterium]
MLHFLMNCSQSRPRGSKTADINWRDYITTDPNICHGQACIRGTRIPVAVVLDNLATNLSHQEILQSYPSLTEESLRAATRYAADLARERIVDLGPRVMV